MDDISGKEESSEEVIELRSSIGFSFEEEVKGRDRYRRGIINELLSSESHREIAFDVIEELNRRRLKFSMDSILCVLRHQPNGVDLNSITDIFNQGA